MTRNSERFVRGGTSVLLEAGAVGMEPTGSSFVLCRLQVGYTSTECSGGTAIIYLAQPALHRLGTDRRHARLQARRPPKKQRWRVANAAPKWHKSGLGIRKAWMSPPAMCIGKRRYKTTSQTKEVVFIWSCILPSRKEMPVAQITDVYPA